jgi:hypothetical protein
MAKKRKASTKAKKARGRKVIKKRRFAPNAPTAKKARVLGRGRVTKTHKELRTLRTTFSASITEASPSGACWFKDPGGSQQCIPATQADCKNEGGVWTPGNCPN